MNVGSRMFLIRKRVVRVFAVELSVTITCKGWGIQLFLRMLGVSMARNQNLLSTLHAVVTYYIAHTFKVMYLKRAQNSHTEMTHTFIRVLARWMKYISS
ncbi:hypothetical protein F5B20DRAFT_489817 [Whalleya microplaca]|nr:hypothetical protein F5B20DRAFT_489817 [Whalleya microplaca]